MLTRRNFLRLAALGAAALIAAPFVQHLPAQQPPLTPVPVPTPTPVAGITPMDFDEALRWLHSAYGGGAQPSLIILPPRTYQYGYSNVGPVEEGDLYTLLFDTEKITSHFKA